MDSTLSMGPGYLVVAPVLGAGNRVSKAFETRKCVCFDGEFDIYHQKLKYCSMANHTERNVEYISRFRAARLEFWNRCYNAWAYQPIPRDQFFPQFVKLPMEIQFMIWKLFLPGNGALLHVISIL